MGLGEYATHGCQHTFGMKAILSVFWVLPATTPPPFRGDRDVVAAAVQKDGDALRFAADDLLEDPTFATVAKRRFLLLKLTMLSGRSTVVAAGYYWNAGDVLAGCRCKLGLEDDGSTMELWHGSGERVPDDTDRRLARHQAAWPDLRVPACRRRAMTNLCAGRVCP
eukprot:3294434-Amphidinium_carterae.1